MNMDEEKNKAHRMKDCSCPMLQCRSCTAEVPDCSMDDGLCRFCADDYQNETDEIAAYEDA
jgi:hypothetical protein